MINAILLISIVSSYSLKAGTFASAGGIFVSSGYTLIGTAGLVATGISQNSNYRLSAGFPYAIVISVTEDPGSDLKFRLLPVMPNPITDRATISFILPRRMKIEVRIFDISGRLVWKKNGEFPQGFNSIRWDGTSISGSKVGSGVYFLRFAADGKEMREKIMVVR